MKLRSANVTQGVERAPNRSLFYAMGYTKEELDRPLVGVISAHSEIVPGHAHLDKIAEAVKAGVRMAGGTPILIPAIGVCDGIAMGHIGMKYSLASRELIADSVETMAMAHQLDALVLVPNCDKIVPGMLMGALRLNIPSVVSFLLFVLLYAPCFVSLATIRMETGSVKWALFSFAFNTCVAMLVATTTYQILSRW